MLYFQWLDAIQSFILAVHFVPRDLLGIWWCGKLP